MKRKYIIISTVLVLFILLSVWWLNSKSKPRGIELHILCDVTNQADTQLTAQAFFEKFVEPYSNESILIKVQPVSNYRNNPASTLQIDAASLIFGNQFKRERKLHKMSLELDSILHDYYFNHEDLQRSNVFEQIVKSANELSKKDVKIKTIIVASDVQENSNWSCYNKQDLALLKKNPTKVERKLTERLKLNNYTGISIYFIHASQTQKDDDLYVLMSNFFADVFSRKGAQCFIQSNL